MHFKNPFKKGVFKILFAKNNFLDKILLSKTFFKLITELESVFIKKSFIKVFSFV